MILILTAVSCQRNNNDESVRIESIHIRKDINRKPDTADNEKNDESSDLNGIIDDVMIAQLNASLEHVAELSKCCYMYFIANKKWPASFKELNDWVKKNKPGINLKEECFKEIHLIPGSDNRLNIQYIYESEKQSFKGEVNLPPPPTDSNPAKDADGI